MIDRALSGEEAEALDAEKYLEALSPAVASVTWRIIYAFAGLPEWTPHPGYFKTRAATRRLHAETSRLVAARRTSGASRNDILGLLLSARDPETGRTMTDPELIADLYSFIFAGHETSAVALGWSLWLLAKDKASQESLREEARQVAGSREIGPDEVEKLVFTRQVIQEAMRLFPPAAGIGRQPREDTTLGDRPVSKNEPIYVATWCLHRHEKLWDDPNGFDPGRFATENAKARHRCAYLPFGAGPRICIGMSFDMLEMVTILATLARDFRFNTVSGHRLRLEPNLTTRPKGALPVIIEPV